MGTSFISLNMFITPLQFRRISPVAVASSKLLLTQDTTNFNIRYDLICTLQTVSQLLFGKNRSLLLVIRILSQDQLQSSLFVVFIWKSDSCFKKYWIWHLIFSRALKTLCMLLWSYIRGMWRVAYYIICLI